MEKDLHIVGFRIGNETYGVRIGSVREIVRVPEIISDKKNRILVVELENKLIGLIVNAASEVLKIPPSEVDSPGSVFAEGESSYVTGVGKLKGRLIILLVIAKLLQRPEYKLLEEAAEPVTTAK